MFSKNKSKYSGVDDPIVIDASDWSFNTQNFFKKLEEGYEVGSSNKEQDSHVSFEDMEDADWDSPPPELNISNDMDWDSPPPSLYELFNENQVSNNNSNNSVNHVTKTIANNKAVNKDWINDTINNIPNSKPEVIIAKVTENAKKDLTGFMYVLGEATTAAVKNETNYFIIKDISSIDYEVYDAAIEALEERGCEVSILNPKMKMQDAVVSF